MRRLRTLHRPSLPGRTRLTGELGWFIVIGLASTVAQALLYWEMRR
ncbi:hypothetical protein ACFYWH_03430 [Streptomyces sp. NPDC003737]